MMLFASWKKLIGALIITNENGAAQGILSERDIVRRMAERPRQTLPQSVVGLMTRGVQTWPPKNLLIIVLKRKVRVGLDICNWYKTLRLQHDHDWQCGAIPAARTGIWSSREWIRWSLAKKGYAGHSVKGIWWWEDYFTASRNNMWLRVLPLVNINLRGFCGGVSAPRIAMFGSISRFRVHSPKR